MGLLRSSSLLKKEASLRVLFQKVCLSVSSRLEMLVFAFLTIFLRKTLSLLLLLFTFSNSRTVRPLGSLDEQLKEEEQQDVLMFRISLNSLSYLPSFPLLEYSGRTLVSLDFSSRMYMIFLNSSSSQASLSWPVQLHLASSCRLVRERYSLMLLLFEHFLDSLKLFKFWKGLNFTSGALREMEEFSWMELNFGLAISTIISLRMPWIRPISSFNLPLSFIFIVLSQMDLRISSASSSSSSSTWLNSPLQSRQDRWESSSLSSVKLLSWYWSSLMVLLPVGAQEVYYFRVFLRVVSDKFGSVLLLNASLLILMGCLRQRE